MSGKPDLPPLYVAPSEPPELKEIGLSSSFIEPTFGVDYLQATPQGIAGVQRKQFPGDFLSSINDGRLGREFPLMESRLKFPLLILEGTARWTSSGALVSAIPAEQRVTRTFLSAVLFSVQFVHRIPYLWTANIGETKSAILAFFAWAAKAEHMGLSRRPGPGLVDGKTSNREWQLHFLQGLPGVGPKQAAKILKHYGRVPLTLDQDARNGGLEQVDGIGPKIAAKIERVFQR